MSTPSPLLAFLTLPLDTNWHSFTIQKSSGLKFLGSSVFQIRLVGLVHIFTTLPLKTNEANMVLSVVFLLRLSLDHRLTSPLYTSRDNKSEPLRRPILGGANMTTVFSSLTDAASRGDLLAIKVKYPS